MLRRLDLNSDMGERDSPEGLALDAALMPLVTSVSLACGGHAGSPDLIRRTAVIAQKHSVAVGAHPGLPDPQTFGRAERPLAATEVRDLITEQVMTCRCVLQSQGLILRHVKPHGALYNIAARDEGVAKAIVAAVQAIDASLLLYALAGSVLARVGETAGLSVVHEGFADRAYRTDGRLVPRGEAGAVITREDRVREQLRRLIAGTVMTVEQKVIPVCIHSLCLHSDTPQTLMLARLIREELERNGIEVLAARHADC